MPKLAFSKFISSSKLSDRLIVTTEQMQAIEAFMFDAGMPIAALMEKVGGLITERIETLYPLSEFPKVGVIAGNGHNGGDALVVARELWHRGRDVKVYLPLSNLKPLTKQHYQYIQALGIPEVALAELETSDLLIDGLFGFGLSRAIAGNLVDLIHKVNAWQLPVLSIDLPSGLNSNTGEVMATAIKATHTLCLGLWKRGLFIEEALAYIGKLELIDFHIPERFIEAVTKKSEPPVKKLWRIETDSALALLPKHRPIATHKYQMGHLLLIGGSERYGGAIILAALGARASGVGMLSIAVPTCLRDLVLAKVPEALVISCPETNSEINPQSNMKAIAHLPDLDFSKYTAIGCGVGISLDARNLVEQVLTINQNLILDADALTLLGQIGLGTLDKRSPQSTILTPHWGEFCRLFSMAPQVDPTQLVPKLDRLQALENAAMNTNAVILLKGARTAICSSLNQITQTWINPESTPALARGGSGDVLTGVMAGLWAQGLSLSDSAIAATVWHSQTGIWLAKQQTEMAVNPVALAENLLNYLGR